jgi:hypothetical protein
MKQSAATLAVLVTLATFIQPCPAPLIAALAGGVALGAGAATAGAVAAQLKRQANGAPATNAMSGQGYADLNQCLVDSSSAFFYYDFTPNSGLTLDQVPASCMPVINEYNASPNIDQLNAQYGWISIVNDTAISTGNLPSSLYSEITTMARMSGLQGAGPHGPGGPPQYGPGSVGYTRRALRFDRGSI